jgi:hypothetical protein
MGGECSANGGGEHAWNTGGKCRTKETTWKANIRIDAVEIERGGVD